MKMKKLFYVLLIIALVWGIAWAGRTVVKDKMLFENANITTSTITTGTIANLTATAATITSPNIKYTVQAKTSDYSVVAGDTVKTLTNLGATAGVEFDLPAITSTTLGLAFKIVNADSNDYTVNVDPNASDMILGLCDANGDMAQSTLNGSVLAMEAVEYTTSTYGWAITSDRTGWADAD